MTYSCHYAPYFSKTALIWPHHYCMLFCVYFPAINSLLKICSIDMYVLFLFFPFFFFFVLFCEEDVLHFSFKLTCFFPPKKKKHVTRSLFIFFKARFQFLSFLFNIKEQKKVLILVLQKAMERDYSYQQIIWNISLIKL